MKTRYIQGGFTLVEMLVAAAMLMSILCMVYGTYFATSSSTEAVGSRLMMFQQGPTLLDRLARQIRCSYVDTVANPSYMAASVDRQEKQRPQDGHDYFFYRSDNLGPEILHMVTANGFGRLLNSPPGLFEVTYKFDKTRGWLWLSQGRFVTAKRGVEKNHWRLIAKNVKCLEFAFFDGRQWMNEWSFESRKKLPNAVKIDITLEDQSRQTYRYGTVVYLSCGKDYSSKSQSGELVTAKNK